MPENRTKCLVVDDEPLSREILMDYIAQCPYLDCIAECKNAIEANQLILTHDIQILFLDINMPMLTGIQWIKSLENPPLVVFTTAYPEYAVEGFNLNAVDYLLKPFSFERFLKAVNKGQEKLLHNEPISSPTDPIDNCLRVKSDKRWFRIAFDEILYLESIGDYLKLHLNSGPLTIHHTLKLILEKLPQHIFLRVHRSYVVNLRHIQYFEGNQVKLGNSFVPVSSSYREELITLFHEKEK
ncbi:MAG: LytR/AlgR family response regulator transcription factor [Marinifilaceae bacterium]